MSTAASIRSGMSGVRWLSAALLSFTVMFPAFGASPAAKPTITAEASAALAQMGQALLGKQFSFQARTLRVYADTDGRFLHIGHTLKVLVRRPDRMRVDIDGDDGATRLFYDGKTLIVYRPGEKEYVSIPVPNTIDGMLKEGGTRLGLDFPLEDFFEPSPRQGGSVRRHRCQDRQRSDDRRCRHQSLHSLSASGS